MPQSIYDLYLPDTRTSGVVFASPHSGAKYPFDFLQASRLDRQVIRSSEDAFIDKVFRCVTDFGAPLLAAKAPRAFIDLNRGPDELDPALVDGVQRPRHTPRIVSGLGVIPRVVAGGQAIYRGKISHAHAQERIDTWWRPYHAQLQAQLDQAHRQFGQAVLIDCHSMPHEALDAAPVSSAGTRPQVVLGDRYGASASRDIVDMVEAAFRRAGYDVARNTPFAGAYTAQHYGRPSRRQHVIQVEIDRALYMDEDTITPLLGFHQFKKRMRGVVADLAEIVTPPHRLAAE